MNPNTTDQATVNSENMELCGTCGKEISKRATACPNCGDPKWRGNPAEGVAGCISGIGQLLIGLMICWALLSATFSFILKKLGIG